MLSRLIPGLCDGLEQYLQRFFVRFQAGCESAFVANRSRIIALLQHRLQGVECFDAHAQRFGERRCSDRRQHKFLHVDGAIGVRAAVDDIHHRDRQHPRGDAAQIAVKRRHFGGGGGSSCGHGNGQDCIRAELALVGCAIELQHRMVNQRLLSRIQVNQGRRDVFIDFGDCFFRPFAQVPRLVAIAEFHCFMLTR